MKRTLVWGWVVAAIFCASLTPSFAHTSSDWDEVEAQIKALPPGFGSGAVGSIPQEVLDEIHQKIVQAPDAPKSVRIIGFYPSDYSLRIRTDGLLENAQSHLIHFPMAIDRSIKIDVGGMYSLFLSAPFSALHILGANITIDASTISGATVEKENAEIETNTKEAIAAIMNGDVNWASVQITKYHCSLTGRSRTVLAVNCTTTHRTSLFHMGEFRDDVEGDLERGSTEAVDVSAKLEPMLGMFFDGDKPPDVADYRINEGPWHSQQASVLLTRSQKQQARELFAQGFDLYKSGDLTGARALIESGLKIDPGNHLGWFTLAEIGRSMVAQSPDDSYGNDAEFVFYQHTIDLAPDSPEAARAKGYLDALR